MADEPLAEWEKSIRTILFMVGSVFFAAAVTQLADSKFLKAVCLLVVAAVFLVLWACWESAKKSLASHQWVRFVFASVVSLVPAIALIAWQLYVSISNKGGSVAPINTISGDKDAKRGAERGDETRPSPLSTETSTSIAASKDITSVSTSFLRSLVKGKYGSEAEESASPFIGKWMKVSGTVFGQIEYHRNSGYTLGLRDDDGSDDFCLLSFDDSRREYVVNLKDGQRIKAICQIKRVDSLAISLADCETQ